MSEKLNFNEAVALGLTELYRLKEELEGSEQIDVSALNIINNAISHLESIQEDEKQEEARAQQQEEIIDGLLQKIGEYELFDSIAVKGQDEGISEFDERRKSYNLVIYDIVREELKANNELNNTTIAEKNGKIRLLNEQSLSVQLQLDVANDTIRDLETDLQQQDIELKRIKEENESREQAIEQQKQTIHQKDQEIQELLSKIKQLEEAQKPTTYTPVDQDIKSRVANLKAQSKRTADEMVNSFFVRNGIPAPEIATLGGEQPDGESFPGQDPISTDTTAELDANGTTEADAGIQSEDITTFPVSNVQTTDGRDTANESMEGTHDHREPTWEEWMQSEIEKVNKRIDRLERHANISEVA